MWHCLISLTLKGLRLKPSLHPQFGQVYFLRVFIKSPLLAYGEFLKRATYACGNKCKARNASDEVNALLNYGYAVLESEVRKDLNSIGLDPSISFLHELSNSRASLVYDVQELYRWLIDLSVIQLLEEKKLKKSDFIVTENYNIRLRENTAKALIEKIRLNFNARALYNGKYYSYQNILYENVRLLANYIMGKLGKLQFNVPEYSLVAKEHLSMTYPLSHGLDQW